MTASWIHSERMGVLVLAAVAGLGACAESGEQGVDPHVPYGEAVAVYNAGGEANLRRAIDLFSQAVEIDSTFAPGWAGLAKAYTSIGGNFNILPPEEVWPFARQAAENALRLDDGAADTYLAVALVRDGADWDWTAAELAYQRALELEPDNVEALNSYAWFLSGLGRSEEAAPFAARAAELAPASGDPFLLYVTTGDAAARIAAADALIAADPGNPNGYWVSALIHTWEGDYERAAERLERQIPLMAGDVVDEVALLGFVYGRMGREADARAMLDRLDAVAAEGRYVSPVLRGWIHSGLGEADEAMAWLRRGVESRAHRSGPGMIAFSKVFEPIRGDARFGELLQSVGLQR